MNIDRAALAGSLMRRRGRAHTRASAEGRVAYATRANTERYIRFSPISGGNFSGLTYTHNNILIIQ